MKKVLFLVLCMPVLTQAQEKGIRFDNSLSWQQAQQKARDENKYIFVDANASWCLPCRTMEKKVFSLEKVGDLYNAQFICLKAQMDTASGDNELTQAWYPDAHYIKDQYEVNAYPTFLFFSPDGKLVHKGMGYCGEEQFIALAEDAHNPTKQYYKLLSEYQGGRRDTATMKYLIDYAGQIDDKLSARQIAADYIKLLSPDDLSKKENILFVNSVNEDLAYKLANNFIDKLNMNDCFVKENIEFIWTFTKSSRDRGFKLFYNNPGRINKIMGKARFVQGTINYIIAKEEVDPLVLAAANGGPDPDWDNILATIKRKYSADHANTIIIDSKIRWYNYKKDYPQYAKYLTMKLDRTNGDHLDGFNLNNDAFEIFKTSTNKAELNRAIYWMHLYQLKNPKDAQSSMAATDTYANLLYKVGRKKEAIEWEEKCHLAEPDNKDWQTVIAKMKAGESTWGEFSAGR